MKTSLTLAALALAATALSGCIVAGDGGAPVDDGLMGTEAQFNAMVAPCTAQAARLTGTAPSIVVILDRIRTGGGPILTLNAGGAKYTCRTESDGTVTVFSEYAN